MDQSRFQESCARVPLVVADICRIRIWNDVAHCETEDEESEAHAREACAESGEL